MNLALRSLFGVAFCFFRDRNRESPQVSIGILHMACIVMTEWPFWGGVREFDAGVHCTLHSHFCKYTDQNEFGELNGEVERFIRTYRGYLVE